MVSLQVEKHSDETKKNWGSWMLTLQQILSPHPVYADAGSGGDEQLPHSDPFQFPQTPCQSACLEKLQSTYETSEGPRKKYV